MKNKKYKISLITISIMLIICISVGLSYAAWKANLTGKNKSTISASCFKVSLTEDNPISLVNAYPMYDNDGKKLTPYTFTITNECSSYVSYQVNLEILKTSTLTNMSYLKAMLNVEEPKLLSNYEASSPTLSTAIKAYKIETGYLDANESKTFNLRIWIDENVTQNTTDAVGRSFSAKVTVSTAYLKDAPKTPAIDTIANLATTDTANLVEDEYGNIRYIGANPNNYIYFNCSNYNRQTAETCELWRIVGIMSDRMELEDGNATALLKIVSTKSLEKVAWNSNEASNNWSTASLQQLLNTDYLNGKYLDENNVSNGLIGNTSDMIETVKWPLGGINNSEFTNLATLGWYDRERGDEVYSDNPTTWTGKIGLLYASDYGYATSGGSTTDRITCLDKELYNWSNSSISDCKNNDWLYKYDSWVLSTISDTDRIGVYKPESADFYMGINSAVYVQLSARPAVYLKESVLIIEGGDGTESNPYRLINS